MNSYTFWLVEKFVGNVLIVNGLVPCTRKWHSTCDHSLVLNSFSAPPFNGQYTQTYMCKHLNTY